MILDRVFVRRPMAARDNIGYERFRVRIVAAYGDGGLGLLGPHSDSGRGISFDRTPRPFGGRKFHFAFGLLGGCSTHFWEFISRRVPSLSDSSSRGWASSRRGGEGREKRAPAQDPNMPI